MTRKHLTGLQDYKLMRLVEMKYVEMKVTDEEFAKFATKELGFPLNRDHICKRRSELDIPATRSINSATKKVDNATMFELVRTLEQRVAMLEKAIGMDGKGAKV
jgi:hypothetical protein